MLIWLSANFGTIITAAILIVITAAVIAVMRKDRKKGGSCCAGCKSCPMADDCASKRKPR